MAVIGTCEMWLDFYHLELLDVATKSSLTFTWLAIMAQYLVKLFLKAVTRQIANYFENIVHKKVISLRIFS